jgi:hypothetical protein
MPGVFDATMVKHKINELFRINHGVADSIHKRFEHHGERDTEWRQHGPIFVHHTEEGPTLVKFEFEADLGGDHEAQERFIAQKLEEAQAALASMVREGEEYHLTLEERPHISTDGGSSHGVTYVMKGIIVQRDPVERSENMDLHIEPR